MTCAHIWADELTEDAYCLLGCGQAYGEWSEEDSDDDWSEEATDR